MVYYESMGNRVRNRRYELGLTQEELSQRTGLSTGHISDIENGNRKQIQGKTIKKLAKGLRLSLEALLGAPGDEEAAVCGD